MPHVPPATRRRLRCIPIALLLTLVLVAALAPAAVGQAARDGGGSVDPVQAHAARVAGLGRSVLQGGGVAAAQAVEHAVDGLDVPGAIAGELIVTTRDAGALQRLQQTGWQALAGTPLRSARGLADRVALVRTDAASTADAARALLADPAVAAVEPNVRRQFMATPNDTSYPAQWAHRQTNAEQAWDTYTGQGATPPLIAILDSGIDATHPDLAPVVVQSLRSADGQIIQGSPDNDPCDIGHGTAVAGSASARGNDGFGITGVLWQSRVIDIALTSPENGCPGGPADSDTITAMAHVTNLPERPQALNLSLGASLPGCPASYQAAIDQARAAGIVVVAAAGNDGSTATSIPASCAGAISVAATDVDGRRASYSQQNPQVDIAAPGGDIAGTVCPTTFGELVAQFVITTARNAVNASLGPVCGGYSDPNGHDLQGISGTSFSAPYVTAAVGLLRQLAADRGTPLSVDQVEAVIEGTARDAGAPGRDCDFGHGILDLGAAVAAVVAGTIPALQPDAPIGSGSCSGGGGGGGGEQLPPGVIRVSDGGTTTDPIAQAVAVSSGGIASGSAPWAVLARVDDFADALAGSAVGLGIGPLHFTASTGGLDPRTESELTRAVQPGGQVFIMGGTAAVPAAVDDRLQQLGLTPVRIAGGGREATAVAASEVVETLTAQASFATRDYAFVASGRAFADAVAAGQMAAFYGIPVLVTNPEGPLHPDTRAELQRLQPSQVYVVGGAAAISDPVMAEIQALGFPTARLAGSTRVDTGIAVADAYVRELGVDANGSLEAARTVAVNVRNNFNDVLSATLIGGQGNIFMPLEQDEAGSVLTDSVRQSGFCGFGGGLLVVGGQDRVSTASAVDANDVLQGTAC